MTSCCPPDIVVADVPCVDLVVSSETFELNVMNPSSIKVSPGGIGNAISALSGLGVAVGASTRVGHDMLVSFSQSAGAILAWIRPV